MCKSVHGIRLGLQAGQSTNHIFFLYINKCRCANFSTTQERAGVYVLKPAGGKMSNGEIQVQVINLEMTVISTLILSMQQGGHDVIHLTSTL